MHVDALTLAALAGEVGSTLVGGRIDDVIQPTPHAIALQIYTGGRNRWLIASAHPQLARIHYIERKPRKLVLDPPSFVMLLRKYLEGARVIEVRQPRWERLIEIGCMHGQPAEQGTDHGPVWLIVEIMGHISNLILRDDSGVILGALRHVGPNENRFRTIAPHVPYRYPPAQTRLLHDGVVPRLAPEEVTDLDLETAGLEMLRTGPRPHGRKGVLQPLIVADVLMAQLAGFGRELAAEATARALGTATTLLTADVSWGSVAYQVRELAALAAQGTTNTWEPTLVYRSPAEDERPYAFAVYHPQQYGKEANLRSVESINAMLATYFEEAEWYNAFEGAKQDLRHLLQTHRDRSLRKQEALLGELHMLDEMQVLRQEADILLAFQQEVPEHVSRFTTQNPFATSEDDSTAMLTMALDPRLSPVENANRKYDRYHKLQRAGNHIPPQLQANELELARIEQLRTDLALADTPAEIALVRAEVTEAGYLRQMRELKRPAKGQSQKGRKTGKTAKPTKRAAEGGTPLRRQSSDGFLLLVGKNSHQNEAITFHQASTNDLWLHARGVPGSHVIIKSGGQLVPATTQLEAAGLAAHYSQSRSAGSVPVDITERRFVRHMKGGGPGMVIYERERTLQVEPADLG